MLRSLYTAISALNLNQTWLDVISDNIANANTTAFKTSNVIFQSQFAQLLSSGSAPSDDSGGTNPTEIGLGAKLGYVCSNFTQGALTSTGSSTDLAIEGNGFFIYSDGFNTYYSREGSLEVDADGYLINTSTGYRVMGWTANETTGDIDTNTEIGSIQISLNSTLARATTSATIAGNLDSSLTVAVADDTTTTAIDESVDGDYVETTIAVYDSLGASQTATVRMTRTTDPLVWSWEITDPTDAEGSGTITFDSDGNYVSSTVAEDAVIGGSAGADDIELTMDFTGLTMLSSDTDAALTTQDGLAAGSVSELSVSSDTGELYLVYSNGLTQLMGQIALANFTNPNGLVRAGSNCYTIGLNSGEAQVGAAGTGGRGSISSGYLEASNVDIAQEFTNLILAQRGFQAASRIITTSDQILQELVNLKQ